MITEKIKTVVKTTLGAKPLQGAYEVALSFADAFQARGSFDVNSGGIHEARRKDLWHRD